MKPKAAAGQSVVGCRERCAFFYMNNHVKCVRMTNTRAAAGPHCFHKFLKQNTDLQESGVRERGRLSVRFKTKDKEK